MGNWVFFLLLTFISIVIHGFFSMFEMAAVSFNRVRLQYFVSQNMHRAVWLQHLLDKPSRLFGTTLIGVNTFLQVGSEASRRFYESINLPPELAPVTQVLIVLIFAELAPMFAARRYSEHVALLGIPVIIFVSKILTPVIIIVNGISFFFNWLFGKKSAGAFYLSKEEIQRAFEESETKSKQDVNVIMGNIFSLRNKYAKNIMIPLHLTPVFSSEATFKEIRNSLSVKYFSYILVYHRNEENLVGVIQTRDLLKAQESQKVADFSKPPWFITENNSVVEILKQFQRNNQNVAVVLDSTGKTLGLITLDLIIEMLFGEVEVIDEQSIKTKRLVERTLSGAMTIEEFNKQFQAHLNYPEIETLSDLINEILKHHPSKGESILIDEYEFTVIEPSLLGAKTIIVKSI
ncbi:MAG: HlyC/CorC family transporter [Chlamydiae bacterium CG10_big_fil_rev_8_21_14_0_10_35_9]|nr:MAG: HlyC/CorC family transporter [Chlamydiae bacterium CG10_big_fil_rev_8_21_14_0_10_35_9]